MTETFPLYLCFLPAGLLLILLTIRSLSEEQSKVFYLIQFILSAAFAITARHPLACLIGYEYRIGRRNILSLFLPSLLHAMIQAVARDYTFPQVLFHMLLLFFASVLLRIAEYLVKSYLSARNQLAKAVSITAVNEMYEKKLNQELVITHYLAEKNARLEERETISRNIHNSVGHSITAAIMTLDAADMLFEASPEKAREKMNAANERIRTSLASIRHAVRVLDNEQPLVSVTDFLDQLLAVADSFMMDTTILITTDCSDILPDLQIPHEHTEFLTGALKELLSNGVRHGRADRFTVRLTADSGHLRLQVSDNGASDFSEENRQERIQNGFGLKKLISYTKRCGGSASFTNEHGFHADITLPLPEKTMEHETN